MTKWISLCPELQFSILSIEAQSLGLCFQSLVQGHFCPPGHLSTEQEICLGPGSSPISYHLVQCITMWPPKHHSTLASKLMKLMPVLALLYWIKNGKECYLFRVQTESMLAKWSPHCRPSIVLHCLTKHDKNSEVNPIGLGNREALICWNQPLNIGKKLAQPSTRL